MDEEQVYFRLDTYLSQKYPDISRAQLQKLIKSSLVRVNGAVNTKGSTKVSDKDTVEVDFPEQNTSNSATFVLPVLYEDKDCVVIDKPVGVLVHSKGAYNPESTVASWLATRQGFDFSYLSDRSGIVHRLDRATSGVMICAKNAAALGHLQKQFQTRKAKKVYRTIVQGHLKPPLAILDLPIERNPKHPQTFRVGANGKSAHTEYEVLKNLETTDLVELRPVTGRTHQLRVHMTHLGHPIVGDTLYKGKKADRLYLHAFKLEITLPNKTRQTFTSPMPTEFDKEPK